MSELPSGASEGRLLPNAIVCGDAREQTARVRPGSVDLALWSPPCLMNTHEGETSLRSWTRLMQELLALHAEVLRPGAFAVVNVADMRTWTDPQDRPLDCNDRAAARPKVESADLARDRTATRVLRVLRTSTIVEQAATAAGLYLYDHRIWSKTPAWPNNAWTRGSYRAVDEWEHLLFFHRPGSYVHDPKRLDRHDWAEWGSRGIWRIPSADRNDETGPRFPVELAERIVRMLTAPGELVLDPFVGTGTTTAVAHLLERRWIGIDIDPDKARAALDHTLMQRPAEQAPTPGPGDTGSVAH